MLVSNANQVVTMAGHTNKPATEEAMAQLRIIENGSIWIEDGKVVEVGKDQEIRNKYKHELSKATVINAKGKTVTPGLIDPHTHLVHAGTRENEYAMRLKGKTYMEIMEAGGGSMQLPGQHSKQVMSNFLKKRESD